MKTIILLFSIALLLACGASSKSKKLPASLSPELEKTSKMLGVEVQALPNDQGLDEFDDIDQGAPEFESSLKAGVVKEQDFMESMMFERSSVFATGPDGTKWEAYCGQAGEIPTVPAEIDFGQKQSDTPRTVVPFRGFISTPENTRQDYDTHHGYSYNPKDVFIGRREEGRLWTSLFFRDVGSHTTAPHYFAMDEAGDAHLAVADVNISDDNSLDLYLMSGSPELEKWDSAYLVDHRAFTSVAQVWIGEWKKDLHLLWSWHSGERKTPGAGLFYVEKTGSRFGRKTRLYSGEVLEWSSAVDPQSGLILVVFAGHDGIYLVAKEAGGEWARPTRVQGVRWVEGGKLQLASGSSASFALTVNDFESSATWTIVPE